MALDDASPVDSNSRVNRRQFLRVTGGTAIVGGLAGCANISDGDGGAQNTVSFATPPVTLPTNIAFQYLEEEGKIKEVFNEDDLTLDYQLTFEDATLFASGQVEMGTMSFFEAARLGVEQDQKLTCFGNIEGVVAAPFVKAGGSYDPAEAGSPQAAVDKIVEDGARIGIPGWSAGSVPHLQLVLSEIYGYELAQDGGDFNVQTTERGPMPQLVKQDDLAWGNHSPASAGLSDLVNDEITPLFWTFNHYVENDWGFPPLVSLSTRSSFVNESPDAMLNMIQLYRDALTYVSNNADEIAESQSGQEVLEAQNAKEARYILNLFMNSEHGAKAPMLRSDPALTDDDISAAKNLLGRLEEFGQIPSGWQDHIEFVKEADLDK